MDQEIKNVLNSKNFIFGAVVICVLLFAVTIVDLDTRMKHNREVQTNFNINLEDVNPLYNQYVAYVKLGVAPSTYSRQPTEFDADTGVKLKNGDDIYSLYESRTLKTGDIGKSFVVKIN